MSAAKKNAPEAGSAPPKPLQYDADTGYLIQLARTLLAICAVTALLLGAVNQITKPRIDAIQAARNRAAMAQVLPAAAYEPVDTDAPGVQALYRASDENGFVGWVAETVSNGSQGEIRMMVGVGPDGCVTGVSVTKHSETANLGTKVVGDQAVLDRFIGMSHAAGEITVNSGANRFDGVSGATFSSRGVAGGVNAALDAAAALAEAEKEG